MKGKDTTKKIPHVKIAILWEIFSTSLIPLICLEKLIEKRNTTHTVQLCRNWFSLLKKWVLIGLSVYLLDYDILNKFVTIKHLCTSSNVLRKVLEEKPFLFSAKNQDIFETTANFCFVLTLTFEFADDAVGNFAIFQRRHGCGVGEWKKIKTINYEEERNQMKQREQKYNLSSKKGKNIFSCKELCTEASCEKQSRWMKSATFELYNKFAFADESFQTIRIKNSETVKEWIALTLLLEHSQYYSPENCNVCHILYDQCRAVLDLWPVPPLRAPLLQAFFPVSASLFQALLAPTNGRKEATRETQRRKETDLYMKKCNMINRYNHCHRRRCCRCWRDFSRQIDGFNGRLLLFRSFPLHVLCGFWIFIQASPTTLSCVWDWLGWLQGLTVHLQQLEGGGGRTAKCSHVRMTQTPEKRQSSALLCRIDTSPQNKMIYPRNFQDCHQR